MSIDVPIFQLRFPEFSDEDEYPAPRIELFISDSIEYIGTDEQRWGSKYNLAQSYLVAHLLHKGTNTEAGDTAAKAGPVASKTAGGVSISHAVTTKIRSDLDDFYMSSSYGQQFLNIRNMCFVGVMVANSL
tara:strand:- start:15271 stop:15663 length:393 start_codon:yes stop_codon:yes gene_type:complete